MSISGDINDWVSHEDLTESKVQEVVRLLRRWMDRVICCSQETICFATRKNVFDFTNVAKSSNKNI